LELDDSERLEYNLSSIIEDGYRRLNDNKHFPTKEAFQTLAHINPCGAIPSACRWDDNIVSMIMQCCENNSFGKLPYVLKLKNTYEYISKLPSDIFNEKKYSNYQNEEYISWNEEGIL